MSNVDFTVGELIDHSPEAYLKSSRISVMKLFVEIVNDFRSKLLHHNCSIGS